MENLAQFLNDLKPRKILDVGTGGGNFIDLIKTLYNDFDSVVGIDTYESAIKSANHNFKDFDNISFEQMDALSMEFDDNSFDMVCLSNSLHHLSNIKGTLLEMERVLKNDGYLLFAEMINNELTVRQQSHMLLHHFAAKIDRLSGEIHNDTWSDNKIKEVCETNSTLSITDSWILDYERTKENTDEEIDWLLGTVDRLTKRVDNDDINEEGKAIKEHIKANGFDSCPTLVVVMKK